MSDTSQTIAVAWEKDLNEPQRETKLLVMLVPSALAAQRVWHQKMRAGEDRGVGKGWRNPWYF